MKLSLISPQVLSGRDSGAHWDITHWPKTHHKKVSFRLKGVGTTFTGGLGRALRGLPGGGVYPRMKTGSIQDQLLSTPILKPELPFKMQICHAICPGNTLCRMTDKILL